uniref:Uncharacterized protein n=1 Tax=Steinernema glaseri TaxID=37863 RepID=A0A1I7YWR0_9BILA
MEYALRFASREEGLSLCLEQSHTAHLSTSFLGTFIPIGRTMYHDDTPCRSYDQQLLTMAVLSQPCGAVKKRKQCAPIRDVRISDIS